MLKIKYKLNYKSKIYNKAKKLKLFLKKNVIFKIQMIKFRFKKLKKLI